jgi:60 kDa SS-A/Ro ribonucleoprotein
VSLYARHVSTRVTPQSEPIPGVAQVANNAGGFVFPVDQWVRLERFLVLGCDSGTYYCSERKLTIENAACIRECLAEDAARTVRTIVAVSDGGRAPRNDPAIFALAMAAGLGQAQLAREALPKVCRTATHLFQFVEAAKALRGWGPSLRRMVGDWYANQTPENLAFQVTKYVQRGGWTHRDVLRRTGPPAPTLAHEAIYRWIAKGSEGLAARTVVRTGIARDYPGHDPAVLPAIIDAYEATKRATTKEEVVRLIRDRNIPREFLEGSHSALLNEPEVWEALLVKMPLTAMIRNLGKMSAVGLLKPLSLAAQLVSARLADGEYLRKSRVHPITVLLAATTYAGGHGVKGSLTWEPVSTINGALDGAFGLAFGNVEPANKRTLIALDVSGSMSFPISGTLLSAREGSAAMAVITARTEPDYHVVGFTNGLTPLGLSRTQSLRDFVASVSALDFGGTDCALPMLYAMENQLTVDTFIIYTDSETWAGGIHPCQALRQYREKTGIAAKLVVVGMTSSGFTIADPQDAGSLDVVGFDSSAPDVIASFSRG